MLQLPNLIVLISTSNTWVATIFDPHYNHSQLTKYIYLTILILVLAACSDVRNEGNPELKIFQGNMNISCFVYRDINRNGIYDIEDRPYGGLNFLLSRPGLPHVLGNSNVSGFANFKMSLNNDIHPINSAGKYLITAQVHQGWEITSANVEQTLNIEELNGSPSGLIAKQTLQPLGVAPKLTISGNLNFEKIRDIDDFQLISTSPNDEKAEVEVDKLGQYIFDVIPGKWKIELKLSDRKIQLRNLNITNYPVRISDFSPENTYANPTNPLNIVSFDDLTTSDTLYEIPSGYAGLKWHNWISVHHKFYRGNGYINNTVSGEFIAYNSSGHPASIYSSKPFDFLGANIGVAWPEAEEGDIQISGWRGDQMIYQDTFRGSVSGPIWFAADYKSVTRIDIGTEKYWQVVMDDFVFTN